MTTSSVTVSSNTCNILQHQLQRDVAPTGFGACSWSLQLEQQLGAWSLQEGMLYVLGSRITSHYGWRAGLAVVDIAVCLTAGLKSPGLG